MNDKITYFFPKAFNRFAHEKNRIWKHLPIERISLWGIGRVPSKNEFIDRLHKMLGEFTPEFFTDINSQDTDAILKCANQTLNHDFDLLGSGLKHFDKIPWHSDFKSGYEWPQNVFYRRLPKNPAGTDLKMPRELSRCHQLLWLGEAYLITNDERYAQEVMDEINDWIGQNPLMYSVNWECAMDVAIRAVNWMYALDFISQSKVLTDCFIAKIYKSLYQHAFFISNNLERIIPYNNNHYTSDIVGLLFLGQLFSSTFKGKHWLRFAKSSLYKDIKEQVYLSGNHYEKSVPYHRLMTELYICSFSILKRTGQTIPEDVTVRIVTMLRFVANYLSQSGKAPQIADNDDGRILPFVKRDFRTHTYLIDNMSVESLIVYNRIQSLIPAVFQLNSTLYPKAGHAILRNGAAYMYFTNGGFSRDCNYVTQGTHTHNDLLSFTLSLGTDDVIIDPGAFVYTPFPERNKEFKSTKKHNTIIVDNEETNLFTDNVFTLTKNRCEQQLHLEEETKCTGSYKTLQGNLYHSRKLELTDEHVFIEDNIKKNGNNHQLLYSLHFNSDVELYIKDYTVMVSTPIHTVSMVFSSDALLSIFIMDDTISPSYGVLSKSKTLCVKSKFNNYTSIKSIITWEKK